MPLISFITPIKGRLESLKRVIASRLVQPDTEQIVIDYDCPDGTSAWLKAHHPEVKVVKVRDQPRFNLPHSRNLGIAAAAGRYFCFADAEIEFAPNFVKALKSKLSPGEFLIPSTRVNGRGGVLVAPAKPCRVRGYDAELGHIGYCREDDEMLWHLDKTLGLIPRTFNHGLVTHIDIAEDKARFYRGDDTRAMLEAGSSRIRARYRGVGGDAIYHPEWGSPLDELEEAPQLALGNPLVSRMLWVMGDPDSRREGSSTGIHLPHLFTLALHCRGNMVECGVRRGATTTPLLAAAVARNVKLTSIDVHADCVKDAMFMLGLTPDDPVLQKHWEFQHGTSWEKAAFFDDASIGLWFFDTSHQYQHTKWELDAFLPKLRPDGIICGHDWSLPYENYGVKRAVREFHQKHVKRFTLLTFDESYGFFALLPRPR